MRMILQGTKTSTAGKINNKYMMQPFAERSHEKMQQVLMHPTAAGPAIHYYMIRGGTDKKNITTWESGTVGGEYIKTYGHYHVGALDETYWVIFGEGIVLLQKRKKDAEGNPIDDNIETFYAVALKAGEEIFIPSEYGHLMLNTGNTWLVTADDSPVNFGEVDAVSLPGHADYLPVQKMQGFAYYVVEENGAPQLVKNLKYKEIPEAKIISITEYNALLK